MRKAAYIVSTGRSGTSLLAGHLAAHPELLARPFFPYEARPSQFLFTWASTGRPPGILDAVTDPTNGVSYIPCQPNDADSRQWFQEHEATFPDMGAVDIADAYYEWAAKVQGKTNAKWYIEKSISFATIPRMHQWGWPLCCILLLRDPRDIFLSVKAFNEKRGFKSFGENSLGNAELLESFINFFLGARNIIAQMQIPHIEVRYERIIEHEEAELGRITQFLEVDSAHPALHLMLNEQSADTDSVRAHRTAPEELSVGRWKVQATEDEKELFLLFGERIALLGY
jgi:hypothetical protein